MPASRHSAISSLVIIEQRLALWGTSNRASFYVRTSYDI
jgi:hypothetical protein